MKYTILYVDDEPNLLDLGKIFLESNGEFFVDTQLSAVEALKILKTRSYDAIVSDYQMPEMDGIRFLKEVRAGYGDLPFILFTGRGREEIVIEAINNGVDFYLQKGGQQKALFSELAHKIKKAVERRQAELTINALINAPPDVSMLLDTSGKVLELNKAATIRFEKTREDLIGSDGYSLLFHEPPGIQHEKLQALVTSKEPVVATDSHKGGVYETHMYPVTDHSGEVTAVAVYSRDVTGAQRSREELEAAYQQLSANEEELRGQFRALEQGEEQIRESEEKYRLVVENSNDTIYIYRDNRFLFINRRATELTGYSHDELLTMDLWELIHPDDRARLQESAVRRLSGEDLESGFYARILLKDGSVRDGEFFVDRVIFQGEPAILGIARDITENKRIMGALRESEMTLRSLSDSLPNGMVYQLLIEPDRTRRFIHVSAGVERIHGVRVEEVLRDPWVLYNQIGPDERARLVEAETRALEQMSTFQFRARIQTPAGDERWILLRSAPRHHPGGGIVWDGVELDFTASQRAEEELKAAYEQLSASDEVLKAQFDEMKKGQEQLAESEEKYRTLVNHTDDGVFIAQDGILVFTNRVLSMLTGYSMDELTGFPFARLVAPEHREMVTSRHKERLSGEFGPEKYEFSLLHKDGTTRVQVRIRVGTGKYRGSPATIGTLHDVTEERRREIALAESEENYRNIIENMQDVFYRIDRNGIITMISPYGARMAGYDSPADIIGKLPIWNFYANPEDRDAFIEYLKREKVVTGYPITLKDRTGSLHYTTASSRLMFNDSGEIDGIEGILHDITPLRQTERALRQANRQITLMTSITRHDIRNQLMVLKGYLELSREFVDNRERNLELITKEQNITGIIDQQIGFTTFFDEMGVKDPSWQDPALLVKRAKESLPFMNILLETGLPAIEIYADPLFEKVFYNIFDNALRYGGEAMTTIRVTAHEDDNGLTLVVEDDGTGIPEEDKERMFTRGFGKNTGLGLFLVKEILTITGITIKETGKPGAGARFEMKIPKGGYRSRGV